MRFKKSFRKMLAMAIAAGTFAVMPLTSAAMKEYEGFGEYVMSDFETPDVAKQRAKARAEQNAMEQVGVYIESYIKTLDAPIAVDEIDILTECILKITDVQYEVIPQEGRKNFVVKANVKTSIDTDDVQAFFQKNKRLTATLIELCRGLRKEMGALDTEIESAKKLIENVQDNQNKSGLQIIINECNQALLSMDEINEGNKLFFQGDNVGAAVLYSRAVEKAVNWDAKQVMGYMMLGRTFANLNDERRAIDTCNKALSIQPQNAVLYFTRGCVYKQFGMIEKSIEDYTKALELSSYDNDSFIYYERGHAYEALGHYPQAIENYTKVVESGAQDAEIYLYRGNVYREMGDVDRSIEDFTKAINLNPQFVIAYHSRAFAYFLRGEYANAIADCTSAIKIAPQNANLYNIRASAYEKTGNYAKAIADYTKAIEITPKDGMLYCSRGGVYSHLEDYANAIVDFTNAIGLTTDNALIYWGRALAYSQTGEYWQAINDCTQLIEIDHNDAKAYHFRGLLYQVVGENAKASADFAMAKSLGYTP